MGFADRQYTSYGDQGFGASTMTPVVKYLLFANIIVFLLSPGLIGPIFPILSHLGAMQAEAVLRGGQIWRLLTAVFLHADGWHLFFNMFVLYQFGPSLERIQGSKRFLVFYLLCGLAGSLLMCLFSRFAAFADLWTASGVGASGAIYGVVLALAVLMPKAKIMLLIPPIPLTLRTFALVIVAIGVFTVGNKGSNYGGELAHLGGGLAGALFAWRPRILDIFCGRDSSNSPAHRPVRMSQYRGKKVVDAQIVSEERNQQVDEILDQVSEKGMQSLTAEQHEILRKYRQGL